MVPIEVSAEVTTAVLKRKALLKIEIEDKSIDNWLTLE
jgi:hypothetical protein